MPSRVLIMMSCFFLFLFPLALAAQDSFPAPAVRSPGKVLGHPGFLIITSAQDSTAGYQWLEGPGPGQISLNWSNGLLTLPDTLVLESFGESDLAVPVTGQLSGAGASGQLEWREGTFTISEPVMISDGSVGLLVSKGELEILGTRIRYRLPEKESPGTNADPRASFFMLAGVMLLIAVLMRRARKKTKEGS